MENRDWRDRENHSRVVMGQSAKDMSEQPAVSKLKTAPVHPHR